MKTLLLSSILYSVSLHCHEKRSPSVFRLHPQLMVKSLELHCPPSLSMMSLTLIPLLWPSSPNHHHLFHKYKPLPSVGHIRELKRLDQTVQIISLNSVNSFMYCTVRISSFIHGTHFSYICLKAIHLFQRKRLHIFNSNDY